MIANRLISLAVVAMLAFAPIFNPVAAQNSTLTPELLARMLDFIARKGTDRDVPAIFANGMFLTLAGQAWPSRQLVREEITGGIIHSISISRGSNKDILLSKNTKERIDIYRIERDGILVVAGVYDLPTRDFNTRGTRDRADIVNCQRSRFMSTIGIAVCGSSAFAIWMASPRKIRAVAGQLHRIKARATACQGVYI